MRLEPRHALWLLIGAAHLAVLMVLAPHRPPPPQPAGQRVALKLLPLPRAAEPVPKPATRPQRQDAPARQAAPAPTRTAPPPTEPMSTEPAPNAPAPQPAADATPAAVASPPASLLINSEATRQAVRQTARAPLLSERAASASQAPGRENAQERFGREVARTAYGNCLKGEFPGGGAGLLSLPFWLAAEASGKCKK